MTWEEISRELFEKRTAKQWKIIDEEFISYTGGTAQLISNGECKIHLWENPKDAQLFCDKLNAINEENEQLKEAVYSWSKSYNRVYEENQSLKFQLDECQNHKLYSRRELEKENEQLKKAIVETEKMVQSTYDELTKLRCFKKNILRIKHSWDYLMEAIQYD